MNKSYTKGLLLLAVIFVWALIAYRFIDLKKGHVQENRDRSKQGVLEEVDKQTVSKRKLSFHYVRSPFYYANQKRTQFKTSQKTKDISSKSIAKIEKRVVSKKVKRKRLTDIRYLGIIKNSDQGNTTVLVDYKGVYLYLQEGDVYESHKFADFTRDSIKVVDGVGAEYILR